MNVDQVKQIMDSISSAEIDDDSAVLYFRDESMRILVGKERDDFMRFYDYLSWRWRVNPHDPESVSLEDYEKWKEKQCAS